MRPKAAALDRFNPVLVKELRAALRAKYFRVVFQVVICASVLVAVFSLASIDLDADAGAGRQFFTPIYLCLCVALLAIVPLSAFFSMSSEWDENTYELLAISNLRPRQIVLGKLFSSAMESLLWFSAFAPLLVLAFLLRGIDIRQILVILAATYVSSAAGAATAIGFSSLARARVWRVLLLLVVAVLALILIVGCVQSAWFVVARPFSGMAGTIITEGMWAMLGVTVGAGVIGTAVACARIAHPEENHSTGLRVVVTALYAAFLAWMTIMLGRHSATRDDLRWALSIGLFGVTIAHLFFATERETLTRRVQRSVPRAGFLALLSTPFLPGGGRAIFLFGVHVAMGVCAGTIAYSLSVTTVDPDVVFFPDLTRYLGFAGYLFVYVAGITLPFSRLSAQAHWRTIARVAVPLLVLLSIFLPAFVGFLVSQHRWVDMDHVLNPFHILDESVTPASLIRMAYAFQAIAIVVALLNVGRLDRAVREVMQASRENRERAGKAA